MLTVIAQESDYNELYYFYIDKDFDYDNENLLCEEMTRRIKAKDPDKEIEAMDIQIFCVFDKQVQPLMEDNMVFLESSDGNL